MPSKKKKYNAKFPTGRIKKIMQSDEEIGKVAQAVPVIISRVLELFIKQLLEKSAKISSNRNAKTLLPCHMKQCIFEEGRFDFLRDLVRNVPDVTAVDENENGTIDATVAIASAAVVPSASNRARKSSNNSRGSASSTTGVRVGAAAAAAAAAAVAATRAADDMDDVDDEEDDDDDEADLVISTDSDATITD